MTVLVTGATGFIGSYLVADLISKGVNVVAVVRDSKKLSPAYRDKIRFITCDLRDSAALRARLDALRKKEPVSSIVHLAGLTDFYASYKKLFQANVVPTRLLLSWCESAGIGKFIFASSIESVGPLTSKDIPAGEDIEPMPVSAYGLSKLAAERHINDYSAQKPSTPKTLILRIGNVYGPGSGFLVPAIARAIEKRSPLVRWRSLWGEFIYNPIFVADVTNFITSLVLQDSEHSGIYNVCGGVSLKLEELYKTIADCIQKELPQGNAPVFAEYFLMLKKYLFKTVGLCDTPTYFLAGAKGRNHRFFSIDKIRSEFGFAPLTSLEEGILRTLNVNGNAGK
ncbi:MAG: hypothetical protein A2Y00_06495 [Omnitrophica WOR_2 bacterium GWF2_43_52]|nr:MAG: hypothetical protein A2062_06250 [Omnitrophica WOR_2 bacterium GWA2_44_7]OGX14485.1 MAG: hypothetical protein A2Y01_08115 [Omnitrophica WOR_2 bacterium GWC2_44_8]OGX21253.1 MAG: hypothetical protein A2Y00_06495 [Omnitrophica WOR_2 bacterium GWF2_43_52]